MINRMFSTKKYSISTGWLMSVVSKKIKFHNSVKIRLINIRIATILFCFNRFPWVLHIWRDLNACEMCYQIEWGCYYLLLVSGNYLHLLLCEIHSPHLHMRKSRTGYERIAFGEIEWYLQLLKRLACPWSSFQANC